MRNQKEKVMLPTSEPNLRVVLLGLPADIAESLSQIVSKRGAILHIPPLYPILQSLDLIREAAPDLVFVWTGGNPGASLLEVVRRAEPQIPTVAVNSHVENREILDALDSGAMDYCIPPFDFTHIEGLLRATDKAVCC
jgi:response regulator of citrate/malate metabolism